ncbi:MAG: CoB--CoM heterodisulfide reductase iron-sulfur subunit A family protein [Candidatus Methanomethylicia archaeon]|nr:CoB--CoM heterodisulfide reductase iron-sulfur subunit A family protein [Candidatus Methanomethylicia archaeon]
MVKVGVYVCHCGKNIAGVVDVKRVVEEISKLKEVSVAVDYIFMCSKNGQQLIIEDIKTGKVNRVVVAACSPTMHEETFMMALEDGGLNKYLLEIANIREQCSWVHYDNPEAATEKAIDMIKAAVKKVCEYQPLEEVNIPIVKRALVIGGGIAGIRAALDIAEAGIEVYIVEKAPSIGGKMAQLDKTFPTLDCSLCILTPLMNEVSKHKNIKLLTNSEIVNVKGRVGSFNVKVKKKARYVDINKCIACGTCSEKCPIKNIQDEFNCGLNFRKAIYKPFPQAIPNAYIIDSKQCLYFLKKICRVCEKVCPVNAVNFNDENEEIEIEVGAIIIATGYELLDASLIQEYGYGKYKDVITGLEFERIVSAEGPTSGKIIRLSDGKIPEEIAIVLCAGSRDERYLPYCCSIGCMAGLKHAYYIASSNKDSKVYIFYTDIRTSEKGYEEFYKRIREMENVYFIRGKPMDIRFENGKLIFEVFDINLNELYRFKVDMVILEVGLIPNPSTSDLALKLKIPKGTNGFLLEAHPKLRPVETTTRGIYICGCAQGLKDIPSSIAQASAAAAQAIKLLSKDYIKSEPYIAKVITEKCSGCWMCISACPYNAIRADRMRNVAEVDSGACMGCGICASACPVKAIIQKQFTDEVINIAIKTLLVK